VYASHVAAIRALKRVLACPARRRTESGSFASAAAGIARSRGDISDRLGRHAAPSHFLPNPANAASRRGLDAFRRSSEGDYQLEATLSKDPLSAAYVHSLLGYEYMVTDQVVAAITCFEKAVLLLPHDPANHHNFAISLLVAGNYERAAEEARRAHDLAPDNPEINRLLDALRDHTEFPQATLNAQSGPKLN